MAHQLVRGGVTPTGRIPIPGRENQYFEAHELSTSAGGTVFGTTPGGSRIVYDRETLLALRNSPLSQTPPKAMAKIPGVTVPLDAAMDEVEPEPEVRSDDEPDGADTTFKME